MNVQRGFQELSVRIRKILTRFGKKKVTEIPSEFFLKKKKVKTVKSLTK